MNAQRPPTRDDLVHYLGPLDDHKVMEILRLEPSFREISIAAAYLAGDDEAMHKAGEPLSGKAAEIHGIAMREEPYLEDR
jgi:hypothetical protein